MLRTAHARSRHKELFPSMTNAYVAGSAKGNRRLFPLMGAGKLLFATDLPMPQGLAMKRH